MNKLKKIGLSALAGSLVAVSAHAAEVGLSGGASVAITSSSDTGKTGYYMNDSVKLTIAGETDSGLTVTTSLELDGDTGQGNSFDSKSITIASDEMGTITYAGHGGDSVVGGWDSKSPSAYEEVWDLTSGADSIIGGFSGNALWRYDSPSFGGVTVSAAYQSEAQTGNVSAYSDMGILIKPEQVEGLEIGYATGQFDESATVLGVDVSTLYAKYAIGSVTIGYQTSENDGPTATTTDESTEYGISFAVTDDFSVSYGEHTLDLGDSSTDQVASGVSASYTSGGATVSASFNEADAVGGSSGTNREAFEIAVSFAF